MFIHFVHALLDSVHPIEPSSYQVTKRCDNKICLANAEYVEFEALTIKNELRALRRLRTQCFDLVVIASISQTSTSKS